MNTLQRNKILAHLAKWRQEYKVPLDEVVIIGSAAMVFRGISLEVGDIDIELPPSRIAILKEGANKTPLKGTNFTSLTFDNYNVELLDVNLGREYEMIGLLKVATLDQLRKDYAGWGRPKDLEKIKMIETFYSKR